MSRASPARTERALSVVAIFGPTGVGKTAVAIALAERLRERGEDPVAVSADALQVYRGLEILTGVATPEERARLEHRLVSFVDASEQFSAGQYAQLAHAEIDRLLEQGRRPLVIGGTGLYLRAALADLDLPPAPPPDRRAYWNARLADEGPERLHAELARRAPWAAESIDPRDGRRIVRALELDDLGALRGPDAPSRLWTRDTRHPTMLIGLVMDREALYARVEARVDAMVAAGAIDEVRRVADTASTTARQALGFEELLRGEVDLMKRNTRRYARRQLTWMRKLPEVHVLDMTGRDPADAAGEIDALLTRSAGGP